MNEQRVSHVLEIKDNDLLEHQRQIRCILAYALITILALLCIIIIIVFIVFPVIFANSIELQRLLMFTNIGLPRNREDFETLPKYPNMSFENFYIQFRNSENKTISLGTWFLPSFLVYSNETINFDEIIRSDTADVVIYFHGSGETRMDPVPMYRVLLRFFHVVAFDYRDYGDSTPAELSEKEVAADSVHIFSWVRARTRRKIYLWAHSLGTPLGTLTVRNLIPSHKPDGLILEAPLTNMHDEIVVHPYGKLFSWLPWFKQTVQGPLQRNNFFFATDEYILDVECPILILHAEDDSIIPYTLGKELANIAAHQRPQDKGNVTYIQFPAELHLDHFRIHSSKQLLTIIPNFTLICDEYYNKTHNIPMVLN